MKNRERQRANRKLGSAPRCNKVNCVSNQVGTCRALQDNNFGKKECPFFKPIDTGVKVSDGNGR